MSLGGQQRLSFDDNELTISLRVDQSPINQCPSVDFEDSVATITANSVQGGGYIKDGNRSHQSMNFGQCRRFKRIQDLSTLGNAHRDAPVAIEPTAEALVGSRCARKPDALAVTPLRDLTLCYLQTT